jgi:hypothetical protein
MRESSSNEINPAGCLYSSSQAQALRLLRGLYGTHQGGRLWFQRYKRELVDINNFKQCHFDPAVFWRKRAGLWIIVAIYVDDSIITGDDTAVVSSLRSALIAISGGTTGELNSFLNLFMKYDLKRGRLEMRHAFYHRQIYDHFQISTEVKATSPYRNAAKSPIVWDDARHLVLLNNSRNIAGSWIYDANTYCPFICHPLSLLFSKMHCPTR